MAMGMPVCSGAKFAEEIGSGISYPFRLLKFGSSRYSSCMGHGIFKVGDLEAIIGDNAADEKSSHRAGYNGLWSLKHRTGSRSLFIPGIAGLNHEHIVSGEGEGQWKKSL